MSDRELTMSADPHALRSPARGRAEGARKGKSAGSGLYREIFDALDHGCFVIEVIFDGERPVDLHYLESNPAAVAMVGEDYAGRLLSEISPGFDPFWVEAFGEVVRTGESRRLQRYAAPPEALFDVHVFRLGGPGSSTVCAVFEDVTERVSTESTLRRRESQQAYLLRLSDALRPLADPARIQLVAMQLLGAHLGASRVNYVEFDDDTTGRVHIEQDYCASGIASTVGTHHLADFGEQTAAVLRQGRTLVRNDVAASQALEAGAKQKYRSLDIAAHVSVPLAKEGRLVAVLAAHHRHPRVWTAAEIEVIEETAQRTWAAVERARAQRALQHSEARFRAVADLVPDLLWQSDETGYRTWGNRRWLEFTGQPLEDAIGFGWRAALHPDDLPGVEDACRRGLETGSEFEVEYRMRQHDGDYRLVSCRIIPIRDGAGTVRQWFGVATDIEDQRRAVESLEREVELRTRSLSASEARFRALVEASAQTVWTTDADGSVIDDSPSWRAFTGQAIGDWLASRWGDMLHPDDRERVLRHWAHCVATNTQFETDYRLWHAPSASWHWTSARAVPLRAGDGRMWGWVGMTIDIEHRKRAEADLRALSLRLTMAQQEERRRISQVLHDDLQQVLFSLQLRSRVVGRQLREAGQDALADTVEDTRGLIRQAIDTTRSLAVDLSPPILSSEGLPQALEWLRRQMLELHGLEVELVADAKISPLDPDLRVLLFQIVRELLFNVKKHAAVDAARVVLAERDERLVIRVEDEGRGCDPTSLTEHHEKSTGLGLLGIRERVRQVGGRVEFDSRASRGTWVRIEVPVEVPVEMPRRPAS